MLNQVIFSRRKNKNILYITAIIFILSLALSTLTVHAGILSFNRSVDASDPFGTVASFSGSSCFGAQPANYDTYTFQVDTTGTYTISIALGSLSDSVMSLYSPSVDPVHPLNNCIEVDDDDGVGLASQITRTLTANTTYVVLVRGFGGAFGTYILNISGPGNIFTVPVSHQPVFTDGRINDYDSASPIVVYPHLINDATGLIIYDVNGVELLVISPQQIADAPDNPDSPVLIAQANNVSLYRIPGEGRGLWQINTPQYNGKTYVMIFPELFRSGGYESFELEG